MLGCPRASPTTTDVSWLRGVRVLYFESHDDFDRGSEAAVLTILRDAGLRVVASFPTWQKVDRTFLACGGELAVGRQCLQMCAEWLRHAAVITGHTTVVKCRDVE